MDYSTSPVETISLLLQNYQKQERRRRGLKDYHKKMRLTQMLCSELSRLGFDVNCRNDGTVEGYLTWQGKIVEVQLTCGSTQEIRPSDVNVLIDGRPGSYQDLQEIVSRLQGV